ncbi:MAG: hypothetical protein NTW08_02100 [Gammaproteobacteria bacterium]|nr:hypothetical protein [Gammaproteobacteria bacterium]
MKFLIFTQPDDADAVAVQLALEKVGHTVRLWFGADQPTLLGHSVWVNPIGASWTSSDLPRAHGLDYYEVIWFRRAAKPKLKKANLHPSDIEFTRRENLIFFDDLTLLMSNQAWWVNHPLAAKKANAKLNQLQLARALGLLIPSTLCSNCPQDIRAFIKKHRQTGTIYKPLRSSVWFEEGGMRALYTSQVKNEQLPSDDILKLTPGIFQPLIEKNYELRVTCFGSYCLAVKLDSQRHEKGKLDFRAAPPGEIKMSLYQLPSEIENKLCSLLRALGIVFGCVDMIVTPDGEYIFLEINEQGQFLWIEELSPDIPLFDCFIQFLLGRSFYFKWNPALLTHRLASYREQTQHQVTQQLNEHVDVSIKKEKLCAVG